MAKPFELSWTQFGRVEADLMPDAAVCDGDCLGAPASIEWDKGDTGSPPLAQRVPSLSEFLDDLI